MSGAARATMAAVALCVGVGACAPRVDAGDANAAAATARAAADTLVGVVSEVGAVPATWLALAPDAGGPSVRLTGTEAAALATVTGAEVWVEGRADAEGFAVARFRVRRVGGAPVDDGVVVRDGSGVALALAGGGRRALLEPDPRLAGMVGARVWMSRPEAGRAASFGVIGGR